MLPRLSLRLRIAAWSATCSALGCALASLVMAYAPYREDISRLDEEVAPRGEAALERVIANDDPLEAPADAFAGMPGFYGFASGSEKKRPVVYPGKLRSRLPAWPPEAGFSDAKHGALPDKRLAVFRRDGAVVMVAYDIADANTALRNRLGFLHLAPLFGIMGGLGGWILAGRALRPVSRLAEAAARITGGNLAERLPTSSEKDEIARLTEMLNRMLDRLENSFAQSARFSADASHELRTPLCIMRASIEEALSSGSWSEKQERTLLGLLDEVVALTGISDNLLLLARFDAGAQPIKPAPVDMSALMEDIVEVAAMLAEPRAITVESSVEPAVSITGDRTLLRRLFMNLADNAVRHNRDDGNLGISLHKAGDKVVVTIRNTGAAIPPEDTARLFSRFFRPAGDRARETGGSGLGLSICQEISRAHGGSLKMAGSDASGTTFIVEFPAT